MSYPQPGDPVPSFEMLADDGATVSNESLLGRRYVMYFYPKDDTPGCTTQACSLRDNFGRVIDTGVEVFGVSPDSVASHVKFRQKYDLPYRLLADAGHQTAEAFGTWVEKTFAGRTYKGVERTSFIIGPDGRVEHVLPRVKPVEHVDLLMERLAA
ncbi:MAG TPA: thioredoxin-dependent thiol peroxidase [Candidatus Limnocylindria bacterium]|jgi:peroxiredoxin Q/BCP|nr:thioredoxin-dependent thiol peroxidase [Candidatus Limnocylindria bacterium]